MSKSKVVYWGQGGDVIERDEPIKYQVVTKDGEHKSYQVDLEVAKKLADKDPKAAPVPEVKKPPKTVG